MLPATRGDSAEEFLTALQQLQNTARSADNLEGAALELAFQDVQQIFQSQILIWSGDDSREPLNSRIQPILTEIHRQMRLLQMDVAFLQASRQSGTARARQVTLSDRVKTLIGYCEALLQTLLK